MVSNTPPYCWGGVFYYISRHYKHQLKINLINKHKRYEKTYFT